MTNAQTSIRSKWYELALNDPSWFADGPPHWRGSDQRSEAMAKQRKRIDRLIHYANITPELAPLIKTLMRCTARMRCLSAACPVCARAFKRLVTKQVRTFMHHRDQIDDEVWSLTIVPAEWMVSSENLALFDFAKAIELVKRLLLKAGVKWAIGAFDFSWNVDPSGCLPPQWSVHLHIFASGNRRLIKTALAMAFRPSAFVARPTRITKMQKTNFRISYPFANFFVMKRKQAISRKRSREARLPSPQKIILYAVLHLLSLRGRMFMFGVRFGIDGKLNCITRNKRQMR